MPRRKKSQGGRPPRHAGEVLRKNRTFRIRARLDELLEEAAAKAGRSVSEEIEHRLELSFWEDRAATAHTGTDVGAELLRMFYSAMVLEGVHPDWTGDPVRAENFRIAMNGIIAGLLGLPFELPTPEKWAEGVETAKQYLRRSSKRAEIKFSHLDPTADWDPSWDKWLAEEKPTRSKRRKAGG
jgi:hypothetical protein